MALPTTLSGLTTTTGTGSLLNGPFISSAGNVYVLGVSASKPHMIKATDPTASFSAVGADPTNPGTNGNVGLIHLASYQVDDVIHVVGAYQSTNYDYSYFTFNMATDAWVVTGELIQGAISPLTSGGAAPQFCASVVVRSGGNVVVAYQGARVTAMGSNWSRIVAKRRTGTNTWVAADGVTNPTPIDAGGSVDYVKPELLLGASDTSHFCFDNNGSITNFQRALTSANALQTQTTITTGTVYQPQQGVSYNDAGTVKCIVGCGDAAGAGFITFDSGNTPTLSSTATNPTGLSSGNYPNRLFNDGTDAWVLYVDGADGDVYVSKSTDGGATWGTRASSLVAAVAGAIATLSMDGNIFTRGSSVVIPYVVNDAGTLKYNEYVVRTISSDTLMAQACF